MKKQIAAGLLLVSALTAFAGCGDNKSDTNGTETVITEDTETAKKTSSADIEYDADDYVKLGDYSDLEITLKEADYIVDEAAVNQYVDGMISYYKPFQKDESKTVVEKGDIVDVDYVGKKDGEAFEGGSAKNQYIDTANNTNAASGSGYIDGFSDGLAGSNVGDTIDCEVTFPEDYASEELKGQTVTFTFTINGVQQKMTRETLTDEYVAEHFEAESVDAYMADVKKFLEQQAENSKKADAYTAVIDTITEKSEVKEFPKGLVEARVDEYIENFKKQYCKDGVTLSDYLSRTYNTTEEDFRAQTVTYMEESVKQELVFETVAKKEGIKFDQKDFDSYVDNLVKGGGFESKDAVYERFGADKESGEKYLKKVYLGNKACEKIAEQAKITYTAEEENTEAAEETETK